MPLLGGLLVLVTWTAASLALISIGLSFIKVRDRWRLTDFAAAIWWGLAVSVILSYALAFVVPVASPTSAIAFLVLLALLGALGWYRVRSAGTTRPRWSRPASALAIALAVAAAYLALAALGPVTHYDAGLYQWAAVQYAADYQVIPGLANLYGPFGYAGAEPLLAALLQATPWGAEGFRLLNGLFLVLLGLEGLSRTLSRPRRPGTAVLLAGIGLAFFPMLWMADFWVTSPTPDLPVLVLALVASAYLTDLTNTRPAPSTLPTLIVLAALMTALRPTAAVLAIGLIVAGIALSVWRKSSPAPFPLAAAASLSAGLGLLIVARDRMLSGWLQYPLGVYSFDVPWRAPNPDDLRTATLGFARDPSNWQEATEGWAWLSAWVERLPQQWDPWWLLAALIVALALLAAPSSRSRRLRPLALLLAPFGIATVTWFVFSPPAFRFGWGPLFGFVAITVGWAIWRRWQTPFLTWLVAAAVLSLSLASGLVRLDTTSERDSRTWLGLPYEVVPLPTPPTTEFMTDSGVKIRVPTESDQCWSVYPMCSPDVAGGQARLQGLKSQIFSED